MIRMQATGERGTVTQNTDHQLPSRSGLLPAFPSGLALVAFFLSLDFPYLGVAPFCLPISATVCDPSENEEAGDE